MCDLIGESISTMYIVYCDCSLLFGQRAIVQRHQTQHVILNVTGLTLFQCWGKIYDVGPALQLNWNSGAMVLH